MHQFPSICPACGAARAQGETICTACGLIFASHQPASGLRPTLLASAPAPALCPRCARPLQPGSTSCAACDAARDFAPLQPKQQLAGGRYTVQRSLSGGGMGAIYLADDHEAFDRTVVIKAMLDYFDPSDPAQVREARDRFVQEARTLSKLRHPAIPQIFTYFQDGSRNYIVMEYIEGQDLEQGLTRHDDATGALIPGKPYPLKDVLRWGAALCRVLEYLASRKPEPVVHHDIKPANLVLDSSSDDIRLVDFGTARARLLVQAGAVGLLQSSIYGTNGYAAPEQYNGHSEPRSDVYALAATLYHLATDDDPRQHPFNFPRLNELDEFGAVLLPALNRIAANRPTATALRQGLEALLTSPLRSIQAPDGTDLADQLALVRWCVWHWEAAATWLYGPLPEQIQMIWGKTRTAIKLREIVNQHRSNPSAGLDAALALLDPRNFGASLPQLKADPEAIYYGALGKIGSVPDRELVIINSGRRYVEAYVISPTWLITPTSELRLAPGQHERLRLIANEWKLALRSTTFDYLIIEQAGQTLLRVQINAAVDSTRSSVVRGLIILFILFMILVVVVIMVFMVNVGGR